MLNNLVEGNRRAGQGRPYLFPIASVHLGVGIGVGIGIGIGVDP